MATNIHPALPGSVNRPEASAEQPIRSNRAVSVALWAVQILLAVVFLFVGAMKLITPVEVMTAQVPMPGLLIQLVGVLEVLGGLGLVLPGLVRVRRDLTPLAAGGLVLLMSGATSATLMLGETLLALLPFGIGILAGAVVYGRRTWLAAG